MPELIIPYATLSIPALLAIHNGLAEQRGKQKLGPWHGNRCELVKRVAILRTRKPLAPKARKVKARTKRSQPIRDAILEALAFVHHYEVAETGEEVSKRSRYQYPADALNSVGLSYADCMKRVRRKFPHTKSLKKKDSGMFRFIASQVRDRAPGFELGTLPDKRPHGTKGRKK